MGIDRPRTRTLSLAALATALAVPTVASAAQTRPEPPEGLSTRLGELASPALRGAPAAEQAEAVSLPPAGLASLMRDGNGLVAEVRVAARTRKRVGGLEAAGAEILHVSPTYRTITVAVDERELEAVGAAPGVEVVTEVLRPQVADAGDSATPSAISTCAGSVTSEADTQLKAALARSQFNVDGGGIKVGVLSDSYDGNAGASTHAAGDVASGDLPGPGNPCGRTTAVQVLDDTVGGSDEGRAMAQLVHDLAPGAELAFATAFGGETAFADNIRDLAAAGAEVIVDDVTYASEPIFQEGVIAGAVNDVTAAGVTYYSSAANNNIISAGRDVASWEAPAYRVSATCPAPVAALGYATQCTDFDPGPGGDNTYGFTIAPGRTARFALQWAQPHRGVTTDLDLYLIQGGTLIHESEDANAGVIGTQKPFEIFSVENMGGGPAAVNLVINRYTGTGGGDAGTPRLKLVHLNNGSSTSFPNEYVTSTAGDIVGPVIFGHNGAGNAMSTAAVPFNNRNTVEGFSSRGPVTHYFGPVTGVTPAPALASPQVLAKPDISATDGGLTTFFGSGNRFFGTSASAPHAAAVAALQLDANPAQSVPQVKTGQIATADPVGAFGPTAAGAGLVDAVGAVGANPPARPTVTVQSGPPATTANRSPSFTFATTGDLRSLICQLDGGAASACGSPYTVPTPLADGPHTLTVTATDYFSRSGSASPSFTVDTTGPRTKIDKGPRKKTTKRKARFRFSSEAGAKFKCALDRKRFSACASPKSLKVKSGKHRFRVRATDALGNVGAPARYGWKVER